MIRFFAQSASRDEVRTVVLIWVVTTAILWLIAYGSSTAIEESNVAQAILDAGRHTGHVHFADSNRQAMGFGHTDAAPIIAALKEVGYTGYLSAEVFPLPDADQCAAQEIKAIKEAIS